MQYQVRNNWLSKQDSNQSMHFICIAFSRRKTRAKLRRARSGEFTARNSMSGGRRAGCYSDQVYRGRASGFQGPKASDISSPPCLLRLLPAGAVAGWDLHPLEKRRLLTAHTRGGLSILPIG